jgi:hypothetical protein
MFAIAQIVARDRAVSPCFGRPLAAAGGAQSASWMKGGVVRRRQYRDGHHH